MRALLLACLTVLCFTACSKPKPVDDATADRAEQVVPQFHMSLNGNDLENIYKKGSEDLKQHRSQQDFVQILSTVRNKLGLVQGTTRQSAEYDTSTAGTLIKLTYKSQYERGEATEEFTVRMQGSMPFLAGYHINADALNK